LLLREDDSSKAPPTKPVAREESEGYLEVPDLHIREGIFGHGNYCFCDQTLFTSSRPRLTPKHTPNILHTRKDVLM